MSPRWLVAYALVGSLVMGWCAYESGSDEDEIRRDMMLGTVLGVPMLLGFVLILLWMSAERLSRRAPSTGRTDG